MQDPKVTFTNKLRELATLTSQVIRTAEDLHKVYFDRGLNKDGNNELVDTDIQENTTLTAADVTEGITLIEQIKNFANNLPVIQGDYKGTINRLRFLAK
jgi:hypothetical protein